MSTWLNACRYLVRDKRGKNSSRAAEIPRDAKRSAKWFSADPSAAANSNILEPDTECRISDQTPIAASVTLLGRFKHPNITPRPCVIGSGKTDEHPEPASYGHAHEGIRMRDSV